MAVNNKKAYTVVELTIVLMIIGIITVLLLPGIITSFQKRGIKGALQKIGTLHNRLFYNSLTKQKVYILMIDREKNLVFPMEYNENGKLVKANEEGLYEINLDDYNAKIYAIYIYGEWEKPKKFAIMYNEGLVNTSVILSIKYKDKQYFLKLYRFFGEYMRKKVLSF